MNGEQFGTVTGAEIRELCRSERLTGSTAGMATNYYQANLVILPQEYAFEFMLFALRNPKPCPLIDATEPGNPEFMRAAAGSDVRSDLPMYCVYRDGKLVEEVRNVADRWRSDHVAFLLGCSFSADAALSGAGVEFAKIAGQSGRFGAYTSNIACVPAGRFSGNMVVNARPVRPGSVGKAAAVTSRYPLAHGGPVHIGDPSMIGVDVLKPEWGEVREVSEPHVPVFWACGVTPQVVAIQSRIPEMITHKAAHMFVTDLNIADPIHW